MKIIHYTEILPSPVEVDGAEGVTIRWLISKGDGAKKFAMRLFELDQDGRTPLHSHAIEHEVFVLEGEGVVLRNGQRVLVNPGTAIFVPGGEEHCFINNGMGVFRFLCLIPI